MFTELIAFLLVVAALKQYGEGETGAGIIFSLLALAFAVEAVLKWRRFWLRKG